MTIDQIRQVLSTGKWVSIAPEIRPSIVKTATGATKPLFCTREFVYPGNDRFELTFFNYADPHAKVPLVKMEIKGHIEFGNAHPIAEGAYELNYFADESFVITLLHDGFVQALNQSPPAEGLEQWALNSPQQVRGKAVPAFGMSAGEDFNEFDLIYIFKDMLYNGSRHVDGRPFDKPENRPTNLQIPLVRK